VPTLSYFSPISLPSKTIIFLPSYGPVDVNGKPAFMTTEAGREVVVFNGIILGREYDRAGFLIDSEGASFVDIGGKLAYNAEKDGKKFAVLDGKELGKEYDYRGILRNIGGKLAYSAIKDGKKIIVFDGNEIGEKYDSVGTHRAIGGKLSFSAVKDGKEIFVFDGVETERQSHPEGYIFYAGFQYAQDVAGKPAYIDYSNNEEVIVYDGKKYGKKYDRLIPPFDIDGKLAYIGIKNDKYFVVLDGKEI